MARKNPVAQELRSKVLAAQRNASRKIARNEAKGVSLAGTKYDPRRPAENVKRYTVPQLQAQLSRLETFNARGTKFGATSTGELLSPKALARYEAAERKLNARRKREFQGIGHVLIPGSSTVTVADRQKIVTPDRPHAGNPAANPYVQIKRKPTAFTSEKALIKITKALEKKLQSNFLAKDLETDRRVANDMATTLNRPDIIERLNKLSDKRFNILWNFTKFAGDLSSPYEIAKERIEGTKSNQPDTWYARRFNENLESAMDLITAAENMDLTPPKPKKKRK